jgi:hypothetical protein
MSAEIINLRQARKARDRKAREAEAETNRRLHGRTKAERKLKDALDSKAQQTLDAHQLERKPGEDPDRDGQG